MNATTIGAIAVGAVILGLSLLGARHPTIHPAEQRVFRAVNGDLWVEHLLLSLPGGQMGFLIVVNILVFLLAFFLDFFELSFIIVPLLAPVADKLGIDLIWFGVLLAVNMQTSFMHPPFGFALFYLRGIADTLFKNGKLPRKVESKDIYMGSIPWVGLQLLLVVIVIFFPQTVVEAMLAAIGLIIIIKQFPLLLGVIEPPRKTIVSSLSAQIGRASCRERVSVVV